MYEIFVMLVYYETSFHLFQQHNQHFLTNVFSELLAPLTWIFTLYIKKKIIPLIFLYYLEISENYFNKTSFLFNYFVICNLPNVPFYLIFIFYFHSFLLLIHRLKFLFNLVHIFFLFLLTVMFIVPPNWNLCYKNI